jgi:hypothetical protein
MNDDGQVGELSGLSGSLPAGLGGLSSLTYLDLKGNMLSGRLPDPLPTTLASARLAGNYLTGTIPASYGATPASTCLISCTPARFALDRFTLQGPDSRIKMCVLLVPASWAQPYEVVLR